MTVEQELTERKPAFSSVSLSVVSHGQGALIKDLLDDLRALPLLAGTELLLTLNLPESESFIQPVPGVEIKLIRNAAPKGFGANHNAAFEQSSGDVFIVVNPDIRLPQPVLPQLLSTLARGRTGACAPVVLSPEGSVEDSVRRFPTLAGFARRVVLRQRSPDYHWNTEPFEVDWAAGMFVAFRREAFAEVGGFDERFFMYLEDADICRRLARDGWRTVVEPRSTVVHAAQRASRRSYRHMRWHAVSAIRYLTGL